MSVIVERIKKEVMTLSNEERADLAEFLIQSLDDDNPDETATQEEINADWMVELERRKQSYLKGEVSCRDADEVIAGLRRKLR